MNRLFQLFLISVFTLFLASCSKENIDANNELYGIWENTQVVDNNVLTTQLIFGKALVGKINRMEDIEGNIISSQNVGDWNKRNDIIEISLEETYILKTSQLVSVETENFVLVKISEEYPGFYDGE